MKKITDWLELEEGMNVVLNNSENALFCEVWDKRRNLHGEKVLELDILNVYDYKEGKYKEQNYPTLRINFEKLIDSEIDSLYHEDDFHLVTLEDKKELNHLYKHLAVNCNNKEWFNSIFMEEQL